MYESKPATALRPGVSLMTRVVLTAVLAVAAAGAASRVHAQDMGAGPMHGPQPGMMMHGGPGGRMGHRIDHMLDGIGATDAQRAQIKQIFMAAGADIKAQHAAGRALHVKAIQIYGAPTLDASAAEALRQQREALHDQASKRWTQAMLDAAKVLTPEQRAKLAQRAQEREAIMQERMAREQREHGPRAPQ
jgi:Spy/CpxP family protein refolding chaperone